MKRVFAMLLCAMMVAGMMAGCTQDQQTSADQTTQQTATEETKEEEKTEETSAESSEIKAPEKDVEMQYISVEDATKVLDSDDYTFLDVRKAEDYNTSHVPGAVGADMDAAKNGDFDAGVATMQQATKDVDNNLVVFATLERAMHRQPPMFCLLWAMICPKSTHWKADLKHGLRHSQKM